MIPIDATALDFSQATPVVSATQKYVVPVPALADGGEPLVIPPGEDRAGEPLVDWQGVPVGDRGVVFRNLVDACWQGAPGDGTAIIIFNAVSEEQAAALHARFTGLASITLAALKRFLHHAESIGLGDRYSSDVDYLRKHLSPVRADALLIEHDGFTMGFLRRNDRDVALALHVASPFEFTGSKVAGQRMPRGGVILRMGDDVHAVQPDVFCQTYRLAQGGRRIRALGSELTTHTPRADGGQSAGR